MQHTAIFEEQVPLTPKDMKQEIESIDAVLEEKVKAKLEGHCSHHGFVLPGTVKILSRSMGMLEKGRFTGSILFHVQAEGEVMNPPEGTILEGEVIRKNKMGMYVSYQDALRIILPRDLHIGDEAFEAVQLQDRVQVEIKKSRFQVNDSYILSVGLFRGLARRARPNAASAVPPGQAGLSGLGGLSAAVDEMEAPDLGAPEELDEGAGEGGEEFEDAEDAESGSAADSTGDAEAEEGVE